MTKKFAAACLLLALSFTTYAKSKPNFSEAEAVLKRGIEDKAYPGCTVCVGTDEKVLWSAAFGNLDYQHKQRVTKKTIYDLASCTKVSGTTSVYMRLVALGKVRVTDHISKYVPDFIAAAPTDEDKAWRNQITLEHMLTHSAGIAGWGPLYKSVNSYSEMIQAIFKTPLANPPGKKFAYSDLTMMTLGEIASRAGGKPLPQLEQELVFQPLGMTDTMRNPPQKLWNRVAPTEKWPDKEGYIQGIVHDENSRAAGGITGHAGLFSTAEDLGKLAAELIRATEGRSKLFPKEVVDDFFTERTFVKNMERALGWAVSLPKEGDKASYYALTHTGFTGTSIRIYPKLNLYVVLLTNRVHPTRENGKLEKVRRQLAETVLAALDKK